jgi:putative Mg2+ transporter-C (MgtC) family protein
MALASEILMGYWSGDEVWTNLIIFMNLLGALVLGLIVGYERSYHGRAAGMRTYSLVCMASCAVTVLSGYPHYWFGGQFTQVSGDPTRVIQGVVTGVGFLGAGVIMREGLNISGLTTAASIWAASAIGVLVGVGFYAAAILLALLCAASMLWIGRLETWLPSRPAIAIAMQFREGYEPKFEVLKRVARERGYEIAEGSLAIEYKEGRPEWRFVAIAFGKDTGEHMDIISRELTNFEGVESYQLAHARN